MKFSVVLGMIVIPFLSFGQNLVTAEHKIDSASVIYVDGVAQKMLLENPKVQIESTQALNDMYNFKFEIAERQFRWIIQGYPWHPIGYFMQALGEWWKIMPELEDESLDENFYAYIDTTIKVAETLHLNKEYQVEAAFFLAAAYGFKGRLLSERSNWTKAAVAGKNALNYMDETRYKGGLSPELLFGYGLYNYYAEWIPENYPALKPILWFFPNGDKELGVKQLNEVTRNALYTRVEASVFLSRILYSDNINREESMQITEYLATQYPDNPYFSRSYARQLYSTGKYRDAEKLCKEILTKVESRQQGFGPKTGRYISFFLGQISESGGNEEDAQNYYEKTLEYGNLEPGGQEGGYYLFAAYKLAIFADLRGDDLAFENYFGLVKKNSNRKDAVWKNMKEYKRKKNS